MHLFLTPHENNFGQAMSYFLSNMSKFLNYSQGRRNHLFGCRYFPTVIPDERHYANVIRYIYQNPVKANMVLRATDYAYSSLGNYLGKNNVGLMLSADGFTKNLFSNGCDGREKWISIVGMALPENDAQIMKKSLNRKTFKLSIEQYQKISKTGTSLVI